MVSKCVAALRFVLQLGLRSLGPLRSIAGAVPALVTSQLSDTWLLYRLLPIELLISSCTEALCWQSWRARPHSSLQTP